MTSKSAPRSASVRDIDPRVANRRMGFQKKGPPAHEVLAEIGVVTVTDLLHHYPRTHIDRTLTVPIRAARMKTVCATSG